MKLILLQLTLCIALLLISTSTTLAQCGGDRWSVKTGTDADAPLVNLNATNPTTIANLSQILAPGTLPDEARIQPTETTTWVVNATMVEYVHSYDSDYHIVFKDNAGRTMIGEIPDPGCIDPSSPFAAGIAHARAQFDAMFTASTNFQTANVPVQITGVGFFDYNEGQEGIAPNAIELHPIVDIVFGPTFSLSAAQPSISIRQGSTTSTTITSTLLGNFNSSVAMSATGFPAGTSVSFSPTSIAAPGSGSTSMTITVDPLTPVGTYNIVVSGSGGGQTRSMGVNLTITFGTQQLLGNPGFENGSTNSAPWTVTSGVIDNSTAQPSHSGTWKAWMNGYGTTHTDTLYQQVSIPSTATAASLSYWRHIETAETTTNKANDTLKVQIRNSSGTVLATLATYSNLNAAAGYLQSTFDLLSYKGQTIQVYLIGVENGNLKTSFIFDDFALNVTTPGGSPDFTITASPTSLSVTAGTSGISTISTSVTGGFNSSIALSASGLPSGVTAAFSPTSIAAPGTGSSTLTLSVGTSVAAGTYNLSVNASGGGLSHSTPISLTVTAAGGGGGGTQQILGNPGFENGSTNPAPWAITPAVIDNSTAEASHTGSWKAWLNGYGTAHTDTLYQQVSIPSSATGAILSFWRHIDTTETTTNLANDTLNVQVRNSSGTVLATLATYSNLDASGGYTQNTFDLTSYKGQTIQIYLIGIENSSLKTSFVFDDFALNVTTPSGTPDFTIASSPAAMSVTAGTSGSSTITTSVSGGFNSSLALSATGLPNGATAAFSPTSIAAPGTGSSTLTVSVGTSVAAGTYNFSVNASGGGLTHSTTISLTVTAAGGGGTTQQILGNPGFENGSTNTAPWIATPAVIDNSGYEPPHSGAWKAWLNGWGTTHTDTLYQQVSIPSTATAATLSFWRHIDTAETANVANDTLTLQIRNSAGTVLATLATYSNLNAAVGFTQVSFDLTAYKGQTIQIYFIGSENSSLETSFVVDDFTLNITTP
jgi:uncharacterized membrane protein